MKFENVVNFIKVRILKLFPNPFDEQQDHKISYDASKLVKTFKLQNKVEPFISEISADILDNRTTEDFTKDINIDYWFYDYKTEIAVLKNASLSFSTLCIILVHPWSHKNINNDSYFFGLKKNKIYDLHVRNLIVPFLTKYKNDIPIIVTLPRNFSVHSSIENIAHLEYFDDDGYKKLKKYLVKLGITDVLLSGYMLDMCVISTTGGYLNLKQDFNTYIVSDLTLSTFPLDITPMDTTAIEIKKASTKSKLFITNTELIRPIIS